MKAALRDQRRAFRKKFGRDPGPDDPLFFDPDASGDTPVQITGQQLRTDTLDAMRKAGIAPALIYAYAKTGLLVSEANQASLPLGALNEWSAAIAEYERMEAEGKGG